MKKREIKKSFFIKIGLVIILIVAGYFGIQYINYKGTNEYKLKEIGYSEDEIKIIEEEFNDNQINSLLKSEYNKNIVKFITERYFIYDNLDRYINLKENEINRSNADIISMVNADADKDFYTDVKESDTSKKELTIVNKFYKLTPEYQPENIVPIKNWYAYANQSIIEIVNSKYIEMWNDAKEEGLTLIVGSSYRDYEFQEELYNRYYNNEGQEAADSISARPGHSEHQLGYALDITTYDNGMDDDFATTPEFEWLKANAYKYGFILRYPKDKEHITGYSYEPWHYRYVGKEVAKTIHELDITFDEYYAYYLK